MIVEVIGRVMLQFLIIQLDSNDHTDINFMLDVLREKIHYIRTEGTQGVEKLSCDADLVILLR